MNKKFYTLAITLLCGIVNVFAQTYMAETPTAGGEYYIYTIKQNKYLTDSSDPVFSNDLTTLWVIGGTFPSEYTMTSKVNQNTFAIYQPGATSLSGSTVSTSVKKSGNDVKMTSEIKGGNYCIYRSNKNGIGSLVNRDVYSTSTGLDLQAHLNYSYEWNFISKNQVDEVATRNNTVTYSDQASETTPQNVTIGNIANPGMTWHGGTWIDEVTGAQNKQYQNTGLDNGFATPYFYENWIDAGVALNGKMYNRTLKTLPQGKFRLTIKAMAQDQNNSGAASGVFAYVSAEKNLNCENIQVAVGPAGDYVLTFENPVEQVVEYGLDLTNNAVCNWVGVGTVTLEYLGALEDKYTPIKELFVEAYNALDDYNKTLDGEQPEIDGYLKETNKVEGTDITYATIKSDVVLRPSDAELNAIEREAAKLKGYLAEAKLVHFKIAYDYAYVRAISLGFSEGYYAPYNNVEAIQHYENAIKAYEDNVLPCEESELEAYVAALKNWSEANPMDVDAIGNTDFDELGETGWTHNNSRTHKIFDGQALTAGYQTDGQITYGKVIGYTMPLEAGRTYELSFRHAAGNSVPGLGYSSEGAKASVLNELGEGLVETTFEGSKTVFSDGAVEVTQKFNTVSEGNYTLVLKSVGPSNTLLDLVSASGTVLNDVHIFKISNTPTAIESVDTTADTKTIYSLNGVQQSSIQKGVNIIRFANGKTGKVIVK